MATLISFNGSNYLVPAYGDSGWAQGSGNLSSYLISVATGCLQTVGGNFTLSANVNFGATYGVLAKYFTSVSTSPATSGVVRLAAGDTICWGTGNYALSQSGGVLSFNGIVLGDTTNYSSSFVGQTSVTITHNLGHYPVVQIIDNSGNLIGPNSLTHGSVNAFTVTFSPALTGTIIYTG